MPRRLLPSAFCIVPSPQRAPPSPLLPPPFHVSLLSRPPLSHCPFPGAPHLCAPLPPCLRVPCPHMTTLPVGRTSPSLDPPFTTHHRPIFTERVFACAIIGARPSPVSPPSLVCTPHPPLVRPYCPVRTEGAFACDLVFARPLPPRPPLARRPPPSPPPPPRSP